MLLRQRNSARRLRFTDRNTSREIVSSDADTWFRETSETRSYSIHPGWERPGGGGYRQSQIRYLATTPVSSAVRSNERHYRICGKLQEARKSRVSREREKEHRAKKTLFLPSPPLISLFSQLGNRPRPPSSHWRAIRAKWVGGSWCLRKNNKFISPLHLLILSLPDYSS